jgi:hypothetical protein
MSSGFWRMKRTRKRRLKPERRKKLIVAAAEMIGTYHLENISNKADYRCPSTTGYEWVTETLGVRRQCYNMFRMDRPVFEKLHNLLVQSYGLRSTRRSQVWNV